MQEQRVYARDLKFTVPTEFNQGAKEEESKEAEVEKQEESKEVKGEEKNNDDKKEKKNKEKKHNDLKEKKNNDLKENKRNQNIDENTGKEEEALNQYIPSAATEQVQIEEQKIEAENKIQENSEENKETEVKPEVTTNQENKIELTDAKEAAQIETKKPEMPQKSQQTIEVQSKLSFTLNVQFFSKFIPIFRINFHLTQQRANFENQKHLFKNNFKIFNFILATSKCC